jgi:hypothetical protein
VLDSALSLRCRQHRIISNRLSFSGGSSRGQRFRLASLGSCLDSLSGLLGVTTATHLSRRRRCDDFGKRPSVQVYRDGLAKGLEVTEIQAKIVVSLDLAF